MKRGKAAPAEGAEIGADDILPEYDFSHARRNKYAGRYAKGTIAVTLDPDVAAVFPDAAKANNALRALAEVIRAHQGDRPKRARSA